MSKFEDPSLRKYMEHFTNEPIGDVFCHSEISERKVFTLDTNDRIYRRLRIEIPSARFPYLGTSLDYGLGDVCIEENEYGFKFFVIDRRSKYNEVEFGNLKDAIDYLVEYEYPNVKRKRETVEKNHYRRIFYEELHLE